LKHFFAVGEKTFGNYRKSAIAAGSSAEYADIINYDAGWVRGAISEVLGTSDSRAQMVDAARRVLSEAMRGEDKRLAQDSAKFVAKYYDMEAQARSDVTSDGQPIGNITVNFIKVDKS
jgi:hypothetical protein